MNSTATLAHLNSRVHRYAQEVMRSRSIAARTWGNEGWETRKWHRDNLAACLAMQGRLERATIYLRMRIYRTQLAEVAS
jgi:hypothetical protein